MKVIAFSTSNKRESINKKLAAYAASLIPDAEVEVLDINDYSVMMYSEDVETALGQPENAKAFLAKLGEADMLIMSTAEHNSYYPAFFKNLFDWCTRIDRNIFQEKPMLLMATSPGGRGGITILELALNALPRFGGNVVAHMSLPNFNDHFDKESNTLKAGEYHTELQAAVTKLCDAVV